MIAWEDFMYTGNPLILEQYYDELKAKTLRTLAGKDGLISTHGALVTADLLESIHLNCKLRDIVDWPPAEFASNGIGERDNHEMMPVNTVVNAFYYQALKVFAQIAGILHKNNDAAEFTKIATRVYESFNSSFFDSSRGRYLDGIGSQHSSLHSNMLALNFGLIPETRISSVVDFIKSRQMACSVYGAQYLLESLYKHNQDDYCLALMTNTSDRGWLNMLQAGSTMTLEAWDLKYKNNLDWNHAWGAAPANIIPRWLVGVRPAKPGFAEVIIDPKPGNLRWFEACVPTIRGPIRVKYEKLSSGKIQADIQIPGNVKRVPWHCVNSI